MQEKEDFLVEIGTEELPPKALLSLSNAFTQQVCEAIDKVELSYGEVQSFATPRRLAIIIKDLSIAQADKTVPRRGPAIKAAYDADGKPSKAALGFAKSCGLNSLEELGQIETDKGAWLVYDALVKGQHASKLLPQIIRTSLDKLPIPKRMRWGASAAQFVRPVHWIVMLLGYDIVDTEIFNLTAGRHTRGHRFHRPMEISLEHPNDYREGLENNGQVIADFSQRREKIRQQVEELAESTHGRAVIDADLLDEVTSMVEWPIAILGSFEQSFLKIPAEVLITTMQTHQKYFYIEDSQGKLRANFITVSNIDSKDMEVVRRGNERVVMPRLEDAAFFWSQDRRQTLSNFGERLKNVVFQARLGSIYDKVNRTEGLALSMANLLGANREYVSRASQLCKCDLMTDMVAEFPNLQGTMGKYYAQFSHEADEVATAIEEHYQPRFAGDEIPASKTGQILAIADKLDTLCGIFVIGQVPTGDKDPFALRRAALGIMRIMVEAKIDIALLPLIQTSVTAYADRVEIKDAHNCVQDIYQFMLERLRAYYLEQDIKAEVFDAVLLQRPEHPYDFHRRVKAVSAFLLLPDAQSLAAANKRIVNIIKKANFDADAVALDERLYTEDAERNLAQEIEQMQLAIQDAVEQGDYQQVLSQLAELRPTVDTFFDNVMVMADDLALRNNRLALLNRLRNLF
ncbi:MAG: glycine--tRNA ligase subunit beta, partial [Thiohalomonadales bacterium]